MAAYAMLSCCFFGLCPNSAITVVRMKVLAHLRAGNKVDPNAIAFGVLLDEEEEEDEEAEYGSTLDSQVPSPFRRRREKQRVQCGIQC